MLHEDKFRIYFVTWVTHNSRVSERMVRFGVKKGKPLRFNSSEELIITKAITDTVKTNNLPVLSYNICKDHVHIVIVVRKRDLFNSVKRIKGRSAYEYNKNRQTKGLRLLQHIWAQKFNRRLLERGEDLDNVIDYIKMNRQYHVLTRNKGLKPLVLKMLTTEEEVFTPQGQGTLVPCGFSGPITPRG